MIILLFILTWTIPAFVFNFIVARYIDKELITRKGIITLFGLSIVTGYFMTLMCIGYMLYIGYLYINRK